MVFLDLGHGCFKISNGIRHQFLVLGNGGREGVIGGTVVGSVLVNLGLKGSLGLLQGFVQIGVSLGEGREVGLELGVQRGKFRGHFILVTLQGLLQGSNLGLEIRFCGFPFVLDVVDI